MSDDAKRPLAARIALPVLAVLGMAALDQWTKAIVDARLRPVGVVRLVPGFAELVYSRNRGAFFSWGENMPNDVRRPLFAAAACVALFVLGRMYWRAKEGAGALRTGILLVCAGAIGNAIDRVRSGEVVDFLHVHAGEAFHWATFNVADIYITFGVVLLVWDALRRPRPRAMPKPETAT